MRRAATDLVHPVHEGLLKTLGVELDPRGNVKANLVDHQTSLPKAFSAATCAAGNRWRSGRSARAASTPNRSTAS
jgi:hypothetical protein